ncbi:MAG: YfhO family protein [Acidobacteria bacterium]|nr:YfhO family protein [Acidobacteriota bacterium]MBV9474525.1 YfhO family protein [Acidobacteriota bacterium]
MTLVLYLLTALALLALAHRFVTPLSRAAAIVLVAMPLLFVGYALVTGGVYAPIDHPYQSEPLAALKGEYGIGAPHNIAVTDIYSQMLPWRRVVQESLARGEWPLWNAYNLCGHLLAAGAQAAVFSPFTWIACLLPAAQSFTFTAAIAFFAAGLCAFLFARELELSECASLIGAAAWLGSTSIVLYIEWPLGFASACMPLVMLAARRIVTAPTVRSAALLTATLTLVLMLGHPETLLHVVLLASAYAVFTMIRLRIAPMRPIVTALVAGLVALALCAIQILPMRKAIAQSAEYEYKVRVWSHEDRAAPRTQMLAYLATDLFPYLYLRKWEVPELPPLRAESFAVGSIALALAAFAVTRRRGDTWFFVASAIACIAVAIAWGPAANALQHFPLLDITHNERLAFAAAMFLAFLAAIGAEEALRAPRAAALPCGIVLALLAAGTWWLTQHVRLAPLPNDWGTYRIHAELGFLAAAALLFAFTRTRAALPLLLGLLLAQRTISESGAHKTFPAHAAYPHLALFDSLANIREPFRIVGLKYALIPATNVYYGLEDARGYDAVTYMGTGRTFPLWCQHQVVWFNRVADLTRPFLSFLNIRFAVAADDAPVPNGWRKVAAMPGSMLLENANVIPRVSVPKRVRLGGTPEQQLAEMLQETDFRDRMWVDAATPAPERVNGPGSIVLRERSRRGMYRFDADMQGDGWVVVSDTAWNGWRAYIDGRRVKSTRANLAFVSVFVPRGRHDVRLVYLPESFVRGRAISAVTLIALAAFALTRARSARSA